MKTLRVILSNQLSKTISCLDGVDVDHDIILLCESKEEFTHVKHHKKKIAFLLSAMRHFVHELVEKGYKVIHSKLDDAENTGSVAQEIVRIAKLKKVDAIVMTLPAEYRLLHDITKALKHIDIPYEMREDTSFLATREEFNAWARDRKDLRMEFFYRQMRQKHNILMHQGKPIGGQWNYDAENRKVPQETLNIPAAYHAKPDDITREVMQLVATHFPDHFGDLEPFYFAVTRRQALNALKVFIEERLPHFGDYQDAMLQGEPWMYHSHISFYLNCGLLQPLECIQAAEQALYDKHASLNSVEGFIRQILGWREYVRGIYWLKMPEYKTLNFFDAQRPLPDLYWTGITQMNCMKQAVLETKKNAYAHHIQRLMVLGNFALIAGIHPDAVNEWYLIVYADAFEWVELPNVTGMVLFADGGMLGSKPYAASGAYINKMSDYCKTCVFKVEHKNGPKACPFNYLYWDFLLRNRKSLAGNHRLKMVYATLDRMDPERLQNIHSDAKLFLQRLKYYDSSKD